ncbi:MAG: phosphosulfolactate synthase [Salibacteraceae bacterium]|jgi:phosphosulfolactate synthase
MNFELPFLPNRTEKPRENGLTMMMDKGLSNRQTEDFIESCGDLMDIVKFGFGTSYITKNLKVKLAMYKDANIKCYLGGTLFEAFIVRNMFDDYRRLLDELNLEFVEVSDGCINIPEETKLDFIKDLAKDFTVLSEVGSKTDADSLTEEDWIRKMKAELQAGAWKVIAEARESGTIGIFDKDGNAKQSMISHISEQIGNENVLWEAPQKSQQVWFIDQFGANVNLGNIAPHEVIPLETLRLGLRGDTVFNFLPEELRKEMM